MGYGPLNVIAAEIVVTVTYISDTILTLNPVRPMLFTNKDII